MVEMLTGLALAFGISFYAFPVIIHVSKEKNLFDVPDDGRKIHASPIPSLGGLGIFAGVIISFLLIATSENSWQRLQYVILSAVVLFFIGAKDDIMSITPLKKFLGQILAAAILIFKGGFVLTNMDGIFGISTLPPLAAYVLSFLTIVVIINAYNLIDGIDGLAGSLTVVSSVFFACYFYANGQYAFSNLAACMVGALLAFLIFNYSPARIFMGDTGSLFLGLFNAILVIEFINTATTAPNWAIPSAPAIGFLVLFVPLFDTLRVFSARILHGASPFTPDRNHVHHILLRTGLSHKSITLVLVLFNVIICALGYYLSFIGSNWLLLTSLLIGTLSLGAILFFYQRKLLRKQEVTNASQNDIPSGNIRKISFEVRKTGND